MAKQIHEIGDEVTGIATAQSSGPCGTSAPEGREVTGKVIGIDPRPKNHKTSRYLVVKENSGPVVFIEEPND